MKKYVFALTCGALLPTRFRGGGRVWGRWWWTWLDCSGDSVPGGTEAGPAGSLGGWWEAASWGLKTQQVVVITVCQPPIQHILYPLLLILTWRAVVVNAVQGSHGELLQGSHVICLWANDPDFSRKPDQSFTQCLAQPLNHITLKNLGRHATSVQKQHRCSCVIYLI